MAALPACHCSCAKQSGPCPLGTNAQACWHHVAQGGTPTTSPVMSPIGSPGPPPLLPCAAERAERGAEPASHAGGALLPVIAAVPDVEPFDMFAAQACPQGARVQGDMQDLALAWTRHCFC